MGTHSGLAELWRIGRLHLRYFAPAWAFPAFLYLSFAAESLLGPIRSSNAIWIEVGSVGVLVLAGVVSTAPYRRRKATLGQTLFWILLVPGFIFILLSLLPFRFPITITDLPTGAECGFGAVKTLFIVLVLLVSSRVVRAEEWVVLRKPAEIGESAPAGISVDSTSIEILESGIRRAKVKVDFLSRRLGFEQFDPKVLSFSIWVTSYDCEKQTLRDESVELHRIDGSVQGFNSSNEPKWHHVPENRAADPSFDFVCGWKPAPFNSKERP